MAPSLSLFSPLFAMRRSWVRIPSRPPNLKKNGALRKPDALSGFRRHEPASRQFPSQAKGKPSASAAIVHPVRRIIGDRCCSLHRGDANYSVTSTSSASFAQVGRFLLQVLVRLRQVAAGTRQVIAGIDCRLFAIEASTEFIFAAGIPRRRVTLHPRCQD